MAAKINYDNSTIIRLLSENSQYAFQLVFDSYHNKIYSVALMYLKSPILAEEVVQDVFLKLWVHRKNLTDIKSLEAWLNTVSKNIILNYLKKISHEWTMRKNWSMKNAEEEDATDFRLRHSEYEKLLKKAVDRLSDQQRLTLKLAKEDRLTYEAIGKKLSLSPLTVKTHISRALASIRSYLQKNGDPILLLLLVLEKLL